jgi:WD40 repeat protein
MVWDLRTGKGIYEIKQSDSILCSRFHPNGFELAVGGKANIISIFDMRRKK